MEPRTETSSTATATLSSDGDESAERDRESPSLSNRSHTAWTVVHRLQLERGVSSAAIASRGKVQQLTQLLASTRRDLDEALGVPDAAALAERLVHERSVVDAQIAALDPEKADADASGLASTGSCFYQCFTAYSRLVKLVQHAQLMDVGGPRDRITDTFALLKEDLARERGFVAGLLSLPDEGVSSLPSRAFADFVVCMHSQAAHIAALRDMQAGADQKELILAAVVPSASLKAVQAQLLRTFDVRGVRRALDRLDWWGMMCEHLDKMHEVQRRLHQEALASTDASSSQSASTAEIRQLVTRAARSIAGDHRGAPCAGAPHQEADGRERASSLSQLALELSETPAEALKSQLLAILHRRARQLSPPATPRGLLTTDTSEADREAGIVPAEWRIPLEDVAFLRQIGAGSNGTCYEARWRGSSTVCVKVSAGRASLGAWRAEVSHLPKLRHPNVIQLLGVIATRPTYCLVLEYCPGGDRAREPAGPTNAPPPPRPASASPVCACVCVRVLSASASCYEFLRGATGTPRRSRRRPDTPRPLPPPTAAACYSLGCPPAADTGRVRPARVAWRRLRNGLPPLARHSPPRPQVVQCATRRGWRRQAHRLWYRHTRRRHQLAVAGGAHCGGGYIPMDGPRGDQSRGLLAPRRRLLLRHGAQDAAAPVSTPTCTCMRPCVYTHVHMHAPLCLHPRHSAACCVHMHAPLCLHPRHSAACCVHMHAVACRRVHMHAAACCTHTLRWSMN